MKTLLSAMNYMMEMAPDIVYAYDGGAWGKPCMSNVKRDKARKAKKLAKLRRKQGRHG